MAFPTAVVIATSFGLVIVLVFAAFYALSILQTPKSRRVAVLVLGDIGRSPRMQNHAVSLATAGWDVDLIGFKGAELFGDVLELKDKITIHYLPPPPPSIARGLKTHFIIFGPLKVLFQIYALIRLLLAIPKFSYILVQNPPSIPTLGVSLYVCMFRSARLVIDWHNLGYTILALRLTPRHPLVRIHLMYEGFFSKFAYAHFSVTDLMRKHLMEKYGLRNVTTLRDLPPPRYKPLNRQAQDLFLATLPETQSVDRKTTKIIVTSTSFTEDENLSLLLWVLRRCYYTENIPRILLLITGKGPQESMYRHIVSTSILAGTGPDAKCTAKMLWLEPQDYPRLLASADLGISLHTSSSGLDFPMKVIDLFGCGTPVCAIRFDAVEEGIEDGVNGVIFDGEDDLYTSLIKLLSNDKELDRLRQGIRNMKWPSWNEEWIEKAEPVFSS